MIFTLHWLELAEYVLIFTTVLCSIIAIASTNLLYVVIPLCFSLVFNLINRSRFQRNYRSKINSYLLEIEEKLSEEIAALKNQKLESDSENVNPRIPANLPETNLPENLEVLETNIRSIQQYLNNNYFLERINKLEEDLQQLNQLQILTEKYQQLEVKIKHLQLTKPLSLNLDTLAGSREEIQKNIIQRESELLLISERIKKLEENLPKLNQLQSLAEKYSRLQGAINLLEETYSLSPTNLPDDLEETKIKFKTIETELFSLAERIKLLELNQQEKPINQLENN